MSEWLVPIISAVLALAGGIYATRGKQATDRGDLTDRLVDQVQEERDKADAKVASRDEIIRQERSENERLRQQNRQQQQRDADYIVRLRRQVEACGQDPEPYPGLER